MHVIRLPLIFVALIAVLIVSRQSEAGHHNHAGVDTKNPVRLAGTVTKVEWINPHVWITIDAKKAGAATQVWRIAAAPLNVLAHRGLTKETLSAGIEVQVQVYPAQDGSYRGDGRNLALPNGKVISLEAVSVDGNTVFSKSPSVK